MKLGDTGHITLAPGEGHKVKLVAFGLNVSGELTFTLESLTVGNTFPATFEQMQTWRRERRYRPRRP